MSPQRTSGEMPPVVVSARALSTRPATQSPAASPNPIPPVLALSGTPTVSATPAVPSASTNEISVAVMTGIDARQPCSSNRFIGERMPVAVTASNKRPVAPGLAASRTGCGKVMSE